MLSHPEIGSAELLKAIKQKKITLGGNRNLKVYGTLNCLAGKRMKRSNRVFFTSEAEAIQEGYRPCGACMRADYPEWKIGGGG
jgi:hypothetical protein